MQCLSSPSFSLMIRCLHVCRPKLYNVLLLTFLHNTPVDFLYFPSWCLRLSCLSSLWPRARIPPPPPPCFVAAADLVLASVGGGAACLQAARSNVLRRRTLDPSSIDSVLFSWASLVRDAVLPPPSRSPEVASLATSTDDVVEPSSRQFRCGTAAVVLATVVLAAPDVTLFVMRCCRFATGFVSSLLAPFSRPLTAAVCIQERFAVHRAQ